MFFIIYVFYHLCFYLLSISLLKVFEFLKLKKKFKFFKLQKKFKI